MKLLVVFLSFGAFLPCFILECKGINHGYEQGHEDRSGSTYFIDSVRHHRSRRNVDGNMASCNSTTNCTEKVNHKYYVSEIIQDGQRYWIDIQADPRTKVQTQLSDHFLRRLTLQLSFRFPYYGHYLNSVVLTTGGFLYMDVHYTSLITDVQYLAPLMAYFSSKQDANSTNSTVLTLDDGTRLTVQWLNVSLHNKTYVGQFNFQCTLHKNGTIWFAYQQIPVPVESIPYEPYHPVRVGISDAFVIDFWNRIERKRHRVFYIYSQVNITKKSIVSGSAVVFHPLKSCVIANSCSQCMILTEATEFSCQWCPKTQRCSDGADRHRAEWHLKGCHDISVKKRSDCVSPTTQPRATKTPSSIRGTAGAQQRGSKRGIGTGAIVGICILLVVVICIAAWCAYAYRHPTSKSGLFLIDATRLPRELFKHSSDGSGKTGSVSPSDVKPQVLS